MASPDRDNGPAAHAAEAEADGPEAAAAASLFSALQAADSSASPFVSLSDSLSAVGAAATASSPSMAWRTLPAVPPPVEGAVPGALGQLLVFFLHTIPSLLFWVIGFATITLPTWLFTLFSMSLTFTMNFTTLYVAPFF
jgi:hypothetical protein